MRGQKARKARAEAKAEAKGEAKDAKDGKVKGKEPTREPSLADELSRVPEEEVDLARPPDQVPLGCCSRVSLSL